MTNYSKAHDEYLESEVLSAGPVRRVQLLYEGAIDAISRARAAQAVKEIRTRAMQVNKAMDILSELSLSLDHASGASITKDLTELYDFVQRQLIEGSSKQLDEPFGNAQQVMMTLLEGWKSVPEIEQPSVASASRSPRSYVPVDYGVGDSVSVGSVSSSLDQMG
jgi:flagellar protein FliS